VYFKNNNNKRIILILISKSILYSTL